MEPKTGAVSLSIVEPALCNRYIAGYIRGVKVGPSPDWLKKRLHAVRQQSVNNVVDATNFVMFNIGQPLHAFSAQALKTKNDKLETKNEYSILVRKAKTGEKITTLDGKEYKLDDSMLLIVDGNANAPIGIAGVKGGLASGIDTSTVDIIIESANFDGVSVRKTAQELKLRTDASSRFEQVISPELAAYGMSAAAELIVQLAGGEIIGFVDAYPNKQEQRSVSVSIDHINRLLGTSFQNTEVEDVFKRLGLEYYSAENMGLRNPYIVNVPLERLDIHIPEDLIEEIGRIVGYDTIEARELSAMPTQFEHSESLQHTEQIREELLSQGYSEVYTSVFSDTGVRAVSNKVGGDKPYLRTNLKDGLSGALKKNILNKDLLGLKEVKIFEIGSVWKKDKEEIHVAIAREKDGVSEKSLSQYEVKGASASFVTSIAERYAPFSRYPYIVRDVAFWTTGKVEAGELENTIRRAAGELLQRIDLFDTFEKSGKTSFAFRLVFQSFDKTLTDDDANHRMESIYKALKTQGYEIR